MLLVRVGPSHTTIITPASPPAPVPVVEGRTATIVDVAPGLSGAMVPSLIRLAANERVVAVDDREVTNDLEAGAVISARAPGGNRFVDVDVASDEGNHRRVLVLMH